MKRLLILSLVLIPTITAWAYDFEVDGFYYNKLTDNTCQVTYKDFWGADYYGDVVIPKQVTYSGTTYTVTSIGKAAFFECTDLTSISIPSSVTDIEYAAFVLCCLGLKSITVEQGNAYFTSDSNCLIDKDNCLVLGCKNSIIPSYVTSIGDFAFYSCHGLTSITIPNSVTSIGRSSFFDCRGLKSITIPESVTSIAASAFSFCSGLTSMTIGDSVTSLGAYAFQNCTGLTSVSIGNSVTSIKNFTFMNCPLLTTVSFGESVTSIGGGVFWDCRALETLVCHSQELISCNGDPLDYPKHTSGTLYVPASVIDQYRTTEPWRYWGSIKTLEDWAAGIEMPETNSTDEVHIYSIDGRQLPEMQHGLNIVNSKKILKR